MSNLSAVEGAFKFAGHFVHFVAQTPVFYKVASNEGDLPLSDDRFEMIGDPRLIFTVPFFPFLMGNACR